jgi:ABC-type multidrug transport system fused ATPase/permease subunit
LADLLKTVAEAAIFILCGLRIIQGDYTVGDFLVFLAFAQGLASESLQFPSLVLDFRTQLRSFARVQAIFELSREREGGRVLEGKGIQVELRDVSFSYDLGEPVLDRISLVLPENKTTAIVGESGSGKTTIMNLIMGFYKPRSGKILVNGIDLEELDLGRYRRDISAVFQDTSIFNRNVYNNVSFGNKEITLERVEEVARELGMESFIAKLPGGFKSLIYQGGLSGGQMQRVGILRAMCKPFKLLLMDEATSHLDSRTEERIVTGINRLSGEGKTRMIIAHRLSTVMAADQIIVMKDGKAVECGTHEELVKMKGHYLDLIQRQYEVDLAPPSSSK